MRSGRPLRRPSGPPCDHGGLVVWRVVAAAILVSALARPATGQDADAPPRLTSRELREDWRILRAALEEGHGGLYRITPRAEMDGHFDRAGAQLDSGMTAFDFVRIAAPVVAAIHDGHTRIDLPPAWEVWLAEQPRLFPFRLAFVRSRAYLHRDYSARGDAPLGAEVLAINGIAMAALMGPILARVPSDGHGVTAKYRALESTITFGRWYTIVFGHTTRYELLVRTAAGETRRLVEPGLTVPALTERYERRYPETVAPGPPLALEVDGDVAVLTIRTFERGAYARSGLAFERALSDALATVRDRAARHLIIDLRGNGGGADEYGKLVYAHLTERPFVFYRSLEINRASFDFLRYSETPDLTVPADRIHPNDHGTFDLLGHPNLGFQSPVEPIYAGAAIVLIDGGSFSATSELLSVMHSNRRAVFVGEESGGAYIGNTSGLSATITLPNTGVRVRIPLVRFTMAVPDDERRYRGIVPDHEVIPTIDDILAGTDVVRAFALDLARRGR